eukprot:535529-Pleurochrysis_carterae.AAC.2
MIAGNAPVCMVAHEVFRKRLPVDSDSRFPVRGAPQPDLRTRRLTSASRICNLLFLVKSDVPACTKHFMLQQLTSHTKLLRLSGGTQGDAHK